ncbi:MAG: hypothetical protein ACM35G_12425, partial [Planctomycetaceae bacterium]
MTASLPLNWCDMSLSKNASEIVCPPAKIRADLQMGAAVGAELARGWFARLLEVALQYRLMGLIVLHALAFASTYFLCYMIRFDGSIPPAYLATMIASLPLVVLLKLASFLATGSHRGLWRYTTFVDMTVLAEAATIGSVALMAVDFLDGGRPPTPRSIVVMDWAGTILVLGGLRGSIRFVRERHYP